MEPRNIYPGSFCIPACFFALTSEAHTVPFSQILVPSEGPPPPACSALGFPLHSPILHCFSPAHQGGCPHVAITHSGAPANQTPSLTTCCGHCTSSLGPSGRAALSATGQLCLFGDSCCSVVSCVHFLQIPWAAYQPSVSSSLIPEFAQIFIR